MLYFTYGHKEKKNTGWKFLTKYIKQKEKTRQKSKESNCKNW